MSSNDPTGVFGGYAGYANYYVSHDYKRGFLAASTYLFRCFAACGSVTTHPLSNAYRFWNDGCVLLARNLLKPWHLFGVTIASF